jgi:menaquinone-dependent protoporphyrinogen oxidase
MESVVLVTYATRSGSTEEVAQAVAQTLRENSVPVDIQPVRSVRSLERYAAVVLGVPLYMGRFHKDAGRFLATNRKALIKVPVALFVLGPAQKNEKDWTGAQMQLQKELAKFSWLSPVSQKIFGGKFDPSKLGFPFSLIPALRKMPASDVRDWTAIRAWTIELAAALQVVPQG